VVLLQSQWDTKSEASSSSIMDWITWLLSSQTVDLGRNEHGNALLLQRAWTSRRTSLLTRDTARTKRTINMLT